MSNENITKCIALNENGEVLNITRGLDQTRNSICVDMTDKLKNIRKGDFLKGDIVLRDTEMGKKYGLRTIIDPEWVKKPLTPAELKHKWQMEKRELENDIRELEFQLMFCTARVQMAVIMADNVSKDNELAEYKRLQTEQTTLEAELAELIANEPQG